MKKATRKALLTAKLYRPGKAGGGQLYHGSRTSGIGTLRRSERGPLGPGVYASPHRPIAERYADENGTIYSFESPKEIFHGMKPWGAGSDVDPYEIWRNQAKAVVAAAPPEKQREIAALFEKLGPDDGYPLYYRLTQMMGSHEAAQDIFRRAGYKGMTGYVDGPETVLFDEVPLTKAEKSPQDDINKAAGGRTGYDTGGTPKLNTMGFYSKAAQVARSLPQKKASGAQLIAMLADPKRGVKRDELVNAGLLTREGKPNKWQDRIITADDLADYLERSVPQLNETSYGASHNYPYKSPNEWQRAISAAERRGNFDEAERLTSAWEEAEGAGGGGAPKFQKYTLPGGENYREVLLRGPDTDQPHKSTHWDEPNVLAHLRMKDRTGPNGEKVLHVEEIQSDWGQEGRDAGFNTPEVKAAHDAWQQKFYDLQRAKFAADDAVRDRYKELEGKYDDLDPNRYAQMEADEKLQELKDFKKQAKDAYEAHHATRPSSDPIPLGPYVTSTEGWTDLALKRALQEAVKGGYDKMVISPGQANAHLYSLEHQLDKIAYDPKLRQLHVWPKGRNHNVINDVTPENISGKIGKDLSKKLLSTDLGDDGLHYLEGGDLRHGGEGMRKYYDRDVPQRLQRLAGSMDPDAKVRLHDFALPTGWNAPEGTNEYGGHSLDITDKMRAAVQQGLPAFKQGGDVNRHLVNSQSPMLEKAMALARALSKR